MSAPHCVRRSFIYHLSNIDGSPEQEHYGLSVFAQSDLAWQEVREATAPQAMGSATRGRGKNGTKIVLILAPCASSVRGNCPHTATVLALQASCSLQASSPVLCRCDLLLVRRASGPVRCAQRERFTLGATFRNGRLTLAKSRRRFSPSRCGGFSILAEDSILPSYVRL